jgi:hypothetical protein
MNESTKGAAAPLSVRQSWMDTPDKQAPFKQLAQPWLMVEHPGLSVARTQV